ncbi:MAG TPA: hypothetical protein VGI91_05510 [Steroidobacteraceae bacterium]
MQAAAAAEHADRPHIIGRGPFERRDEVATRKARGSALAALRPAREADAKFARTSFFAHSGIAMDLSPPLPQQFTIAIYF